MLWTTTARNWHIGGWWSFVIRRSVIEHNICTYILAILLRFKRSTGVCLKNVLSLVFTSAKTIIVPHQYWHTYTIICRREKSGGSKVLTESPHPTGRYPPSRTVGKHWQTYIPTADLLYTCRYIACIYHTCTHILTCMRTFEIKYNIKSRVFR